MTNLAALTAVLALAAGLAACTSSGSSTATATAKASHDAGVEHRDTLREAHRLRRGVTTSWCST